MGWDDDVKRFKESLLEKGFAKPSKVIDIGEKYEIVTGIPEDKAGGLDSRLMPNLHQKWLPEVNIEGPYNDQLYKSYNEQVFYENFIQPLFKLYKYGINKKHFDIIQSLHTHNWEKKINIEVLGPEKALFKKENGEVKSLTVGEIEVTLILVTHFLDDLYKYSARKIARRFGSSVSWVGDFRKRIQKAYGKMISTQIDDHLEMQLQRCEGILDTFMEKARDGDPYAAKIVKEFMDKEDQYIMPTLEQLPVKDSEEKNAAAMKRLEEIFSRKKELEDKK